MSSNFAEATFKKFYLKFIYYSIATLLICVLQLSFSFLISVKGIIPDLLILLIIWITLRDGKIVGLISAFCIGLLYDYLSLNIFGVNAFTKTLVAYVAGFFYKENEFMNIVKSNKIFIIVLLSTFLHNIIYYLLMINLTDSNLWNIYFKFVFGSLLYTFIFSLASFFFRIKKFW